MLVDEATSCLRKNLFRGIDYITLFSFKTKEKILSCVNTICRKNYDPGCPANGARGMAQHIFVVLLFLRFTHFRLLNVQMPKSWTIEQPFLVAQNWFGLETKESFGHFFTEW